VLGLLDQIAWAVRGGTRLGMLGLRDEICDGYLVFTVFWRCGPEIRAGRKPRTFRFVLRCNLITILFCLLHLLVAVIRFVI
jgi:hypothetical protein